MRLSTGLITYLTAYNNNIFPNNYYPLTNNWNPLTNEDLKIIGNDRGGLYQINKELGELKDLEEDT